MSNYKHEKAAYTESTAVVKWNFTPRNEPNVGEFSDLEPNRERKHQEQTRKQPEK